MSSDTSDSEDSSSASSESSDFDGEGGEELTQQDYDEEYEDEYARKEKEGMRQIEEATASMRLLGNEEAMRYPVSIHHRGASQKSSSVHCSVSPAND